MKRLIATLFINILITGLFAQINKYGTPVSKSYSMQVTHGSEQNWSITKDKFGSVYFSNDDNMVIRYDGTNWSTIPLNPNNITTARVIAADDNGIIYVGGTGEFGYIEPDSTGRRVYRSLVNRIKDAKDISGRIVYDTSLVKNAEVGEFVIGEIKSLIIKDSIVYFLSSGTLYIFNTQTDELSFINLRKLRFRQFERAYFINNKIILANNILGLFELKDNAIVQLPAGAFFKYKMCLSVLPLSEDKLIVSTLNSGVFLYDSRTGTIDSSFIDRDLFNKFKESSYIYCGTKIASGGFAFGTTSDGVYVFNEKGEIVYHLNSSTFDIEDNAVRAIYSDPNSELWISTTGSLTKIYINLPFTQITSKTGLVGSVNNFCNFEGSIYVATDQGLFKNEIDEEGNRIFNQFQDINQQIFPLQVAKVGNENFLLAGSTLLGGVHQIFSNGRMVKIPKILNPTRTILQSKINKNRFFFGFTNNVIFIMDYIAGKWSIYARIKNVPGMTNSFGELENGDLLIFNNSPDGLFKVPVHDSIPVQYTEEKGIPVTGLNYLSEYNGDYFFSTKSGILKRNTTTDIWEPCDFLTGDYTKNKNIDGLYISPEGNLWVATNEDRYYDILFTKVNDSISQTKGGDLLMLPSLKYLFSSTIEGQVWISKSTSIYVVDDAKLNQPQPSVQPLLTKILFKSHGEDSIVMNETFFRKNSLGRRFPLSSDSGEKGLEFTYNLNSPSFFWTTPYMIQEEETLYSYKLEGFEDVWSKWEKISYKEYTNLSFGKYTFKLKAKTATDIESQEASYSFIIIKPWYVTPWMILLYAFAAILSVFGIIMAYTKRLKNENIRLEGIVAERTAVVVKQKEELESSIHYASRIQMALLPSEAILSENIKNYFVLLKPRDIVSGDFYWMTKKDNRLYIVAADCTGHGVPGAFMSLLGMSFLDEIIDKEVSPRADFILNELRLHVTDSLKQVGGDDEAKDGMDIALLVIDFNTQRIEFSGAYNPCFRVRKLADHEVSKYEDDSAEKPDGSMSNGKYLLETIYASKMPIGISSRMNEDFVFYDWNLEKGISYYMFSDGYIDQFGGSHGRKFMKKSFKRLILEIQDYPMKRQKELLEKNLKDWMGQTPQIDDILVMGIRTE
jgi:serine phosphatase RsbU (regulator of sigma subunit)